MSSRLWENVILWKSRLSRALSCRSLSVVHRHHSGGAVLRVWKDCFDATAAVRHEASCMSRALFSSSFVRTSAGSSVSLRSVSVLQNSHSQEVLGRSFSCECSMFTSCGDVSAAMWSSSVLRGSLLSEEMSCWRMSVRGGEKRSGSSGVLWPDLWEENGLWTSLSAEMSL